MFSEFGVPNLVSTPTSYVLRHYNKNKVAHKNLTDTIPPNLIGQNSASKLNFIFH